MPEQDRPQHDKDEASRHSRESDRRGEHVYPHSEQDDKERPSQRERDDLVERLERSR